MYRFIRATWFRRHDLMELSKLLAPDFTVVRPFEPSPDPYLGMEHGSFLVKADTLYAMLEPDKATLYQREEAPFTPKDLDLRERVFKLYPHTFRAPTAAVSKEPPFTVQK